MKRKIISIDEEKCNGCGKCVLSCHENAIALINGKAHLVREDYCDGLGDCLPSCPCNAISFKIIEAKEIFKIENNIEDIEKNNQLEKMWPIQLKLAHVTSEIYENKELVIASDCSAYMHPSFYQDFVKGKALLIGCPKLDKEDYSEKISQILKYNYILGITLVVMDVPCCSRMIDFVKDAIIKAKSKIPLKIKVISLNGEILK